MTLYIICLFIVTIAPTCFLGAYIYKKDIYEKESSKLLIRLFLAGILSAVLTLIISFILGMLFPLFKADTFTIVHSSFFELFIYVFIGVALVEEFSKWILVKKIAWKNKEFNYLYDAIVYSVFVSLGFATIENILYALQISTVKNVVLRAILAVPGHAFNGVFMGYHLGKAKLFKLYGDKRNSKKYLLLSLFVPTLLHGIYDFLIFAEARNSLFWWIFILFVIFLYVISFIYIAKVSKDATNFFNKQNNIIENQENILCPYCNSSIKSSSRFCSQCGRMIK